MISAIAPRQSPLIPDSGRVTFRYAKFSGSGKFGVRLLPEIPELRAAHAVEFGGVERMRTGRGFVRCGSDPELAQAWIEKGPRTRRVGWNRGSTGNFFSWAGGFPPAVF